MIVNVQEVEARGLATVESYHPVEAHHGCVEMNIIAAGDGTATFVKKIRMEAAYKGLQDRGLAPSLGNPTRMAIPTTMRTSFSMEVMLRTPLSGSA